MDGHDDFADWSSFREQRGGRDDRRTPDQYSYDFDGDSRVPAPRSGGDSRYASLAELSSGRERADDREWDRGDDWDRGRDRYQAPADPDFAPRGPRSAPPVDPDFAPRGARSGEPLPPPDPGFAPRVQRPDVPPMPMSPMSPAGPPMSPAGPPMLGGAPDPIQQPTSTVDAAAVRRSVSDSDGIYRSKRPALLVLFGVVAGLGELMMARSLLDGAFDGPAGPALAPLLAMLGLPFLALGLYAVTTGAATAVQFQGPRVWLRTPLVYLLVGLGLLLAAGTAA
ncbi:hypothetical protein [Catellatospora bangladeshensis]|uniref:Uncharacterized protein n=1 Tax=Catellatospora bangladeshensis TaxID=310355 RepID=A0A8J3JRR6_9ACTN|nr:hypothetical protein [Catellatospora bangladeshensis]GIF85732.1 hypothetical protein Cba03nite_70810 [Catellatospora bangladeshensis]